MKIQLFAGFRMRERQFFGVQKKAVQILDRFSYFHVSDRVVAPFVINFVADDRMIQKGEMNADLMRSAGFDFDIEQREFFVSLANFP